MSQMRIGILALLCARRSAECPAELEEDGREEPSIAEAPSCSAPAPRARPHPRRPTVDLSEYPLSGSIPFHPALPLRSSDHPLCQIEKLLLKRRPERLLLLSLYASSP